MLIFNGKLGIEDFYKIIIENKSIQIEDSTIKAVEESFNFLKKFSENKIIYGVNTGFGPMAQYKIKDSERIQLQYNLIRSHASGTGNPISPKYVKAAMLARLNTLSLGHSGVHKSVIELMTELINRDITPLIYEHGGVGASGDLAPLSHLCLPLIGHGEVHYKGQKMPSSQALEACGLSKVILSSKEGLALINGTQFMSAYATWCVAEGERLMERSMTFPMAAMAKIIITKPELSTKCIIKPST